MSNDIEIITAIIYAFITFLMLTIAVIVFIYYSRKKITQKELEKKDLEISYQKKIINAAIITQEKERKRIARDLHDDISSKLNIISLNSHLLQNSNLKEVEINQITNNIIETSSKILDSTRRISHDLLPPILEEFGIDKALEELASNYTNNNLNVNYINPFKQDIFNEIEKHFHLHLFRIFQELVSNSIKHGLASKIEISIEKTKNIRTAKYYDNGSGFNKNDTKTKSGLGMKNIESRIDFINAQLKIKSQVNDGVLIEIIF